MTSSHSNCACAAPGAHSVAIGGALCPSDTADHQSTERAKDLCPITADHITDDQCALMICVAPAVPPVSVHQCQLSVLIHATCQCPSVPHFSAHQCHINATYQCPSELPFSVTYQCQSVPPIN
ncbi:unnamed protein product, partial [Staurois parvus]